MSVAVAAVTVQLSRQLVASLVVTGVVQNYCLLYLRRLVSVGSLVLEQQFKGSSLLSLQRHSLENTLQAYS